MRGGVQHSLDGIILSLEAKQGGDTNEEQALQSDSDSEVDESLGASMVARAGPSQIADDEPTDDEMTDVDEEEEEELGGDGGGDGGGGELGGGGGELGDGGGGGGGLSCPQRKRRRRQRSTSPPTPRRARPTHDGSDHGSDDVVDAGDVDINAWL
jgi:hypothetical protein